MNLRDELPIWSYREVKVALSLGECMMIAESSIQFVNELRERRFDFFKDKFVSSINEADFCKSYEYFAQLQASNLDIQEIKSLEQRQKEKSEKLLDSSNESITDLDEDFFGFDLMNQINDIATQKIEISLELNPLVEALRVNEAYQREVNYRVNDEISMNESDDWIPPSNFEHGTDDEKEVWEDFKRSQNSRK
jgi:hypothetical protein